MSTMVFQVDTAITLPTHICINKLTEIKVLLVQTSRHKQTAHLWPQWFGQGKQRNKP